MTGGGSNVNDLTVSVISYFDITTAGDSTDFGDLNNGNNRPEAVSNGSRGVFLGGQTTTISDPFRTGPMEYITISTTGNATTFGMYIASDGKQGIRDGAACSNSLRGVYSGGRHNATASDSTDDGTNLDMYTNEMYYITIATTGNATFFGDLYSALGSRANHCGAANATRGLFAGGTDFTNTGSLVGLM